MSTKDFAIACGVSLVDCDKSWGGIVGYTEKDNPNCTVCGFKTADAAYKHWLKSKFGEQTAKEVVKLLKLKK